MYLVLNILNLSKMHGIVMFWSTRVVRLFSNLCHKQWDPSTIFGWEKTQIHFCFLSNYIIFHWRRYSLICFREQMCRNKLRNGHRHYQHLKLMNYVARPREIGVKISFDQFYLVNSFCDLYYIKACHNSQLKTKGSILTFCKHCCVLVICVTLLFLFHYLNIS